MKRLIVLAAILALGLAPFVYGNTRVLAQQPSRDSLLATYRKNLDDYRRLEDQYTVAYRQYANLRTLASQEEAVQALRSVLLARADVLLTYYDLLAFALETNAGADAGKKTLVLQTIKTLQDDLRSHRNRSEIATDRVKADEEAVYIQSQEKRMRLAADQAMSLDLIGRHVAALTAIDLVKKEVDQSIETSAMSETQKIEKRRGSEELGRSMQAISAAITAATSYYDKSVTSSSSDNLNTIASLLSPGYIQILRSHEYLQELIK